MNDNVKREYDGVRRYCSCIVDFSNSHDHLPYLQERIEQLYVFCDVHLSFPISERFNKNLNLWKTRCSLGSNAVLVEISKKCSIN
ncbi:hypothetical protein R3W88_020285 [Solanum pinnatisectum]|uniref:Uncharacterized protein n=1 Tax=Solanum pinnatisectum TaxID=50273 RepID=A0AAV9KMK9_9SOLN|nr:hypothetical protein R3W88_020285 [Solanum pinnatisectum]